MLDLAMPLKNIPSTDQEPVLALLSASREPSGFQAQWIISPSEGESKSRTKPVVIFSESWASV